MSKSENSNEKILSNCNPTTSNSSIPSITLYIPDDDKSRYENVDVDGKKSDYSAFSLLYLYGSNTLPKPW